jgi:hypothetical protein
MVCARRRLCKKVILYFSSEIKEDYMDPNLVQNTKNQLDAKKSSLKFLYFKI